MATEASARAIFEMNREAAARQFEMERAEQLSKVNDRSLVWLALVPSWTLALARACDFPRGEGLGLEETFRQVEAARYCVSSRPWPSGVTAASRDDLQSFWMPDAVRAEVLQDAVQGGGLGGLLQEVLGISARIMSAREARVPFPDGVERWAEMASMAGDSAALAKWLDGKTEELLAAGEPGELLQWIEMARPLEGLLGGALTIAIGRAVRRLELHHRLADDKRRLDKFLERREQVEAFEDLLADASDRWALHYIGSGGVGKTMLIRHLTADLSPSLNLSTARVDFDYLNPDYPARAPGLLMAQLAEELRVHDHTGAAARLFAAFIEKVLNLHERLGAATVWSQFTLDSVMGPVYEALPLFTEAAAKLPQPVIIILDTCEELAKIRADGAIPPSVQATFGLLERLHEMLPSVRVIFSGRRPLAQEGAGWTAPSCQLPARPYLRAHEILGFTYDEADDYLRRIEGVREDAVAPVIEHSAAGGDRRQLCWTAQTPSPRPKESKRYNPFDLSLYAAWLREDPDLALEAIKTGDVDRYIDMRIVRRLKHPDLLALLPAVALMGRCDYNVLRAVSGLDAAAFNTIFMELSNQEWVTRQSAQMLEVDRGLQPRLLRYLEHTKPKELEAARRALVAHLEKVTVDDDLARLDVSHFGTTFRLLGSEPQRALAWWERAERRFADEEAYDWLKRVCASIMGEEEEESAQLAAAAVAPDAALLRAAVCASLAAAMTHVGSFEEVEAWWARALAYAEQHPSPEQSARLLRRARAGRLAAAARYDETGPGEEQIGWLWKTLGEVRFGELDTQMTGALVAAAEAVIEFVEATGHKPAPDLAPLAHFTDILGGPGGYPEPARFAAAMTGRLCFLAGSRDEGLRWFRRATRGVSDSAGWAAQAPTGPPPPAGEETPGPGDYETAQTWLDWVAPAHIGSRVRLEFIRHAYPALSASEVLAEVGDRIPEPTNVDSDRLGSAILELRGAGSLRLAELSNDLWSWSNIYFGRSRYGVQQEPACLAHRAYPPLFAYAAETAAARGMVDEAVKMLQQESSDAEAAVTQFAAVLEADRACLRIVRRMRLRDEDVGVSTSVQSSEEFQDLNLLRTIAALSNPKPEVAPTVDPVFHGRVGRPSRLALAHARYRTTRALTPDALKKLADWMAGVVEPLSPDPDASPEELHWLLDCVELNECGRRLHGRRPFPNIRGGQVKKAKLWRDASTPSLERLTLLLRHAALDTSKDAILQVDKNLVVHVGYRRAARIALDEGELLALRLPDRAARLLDQAHRWFERARDPVGAFISKVCSALASARENNNAALGRALGRIRKDYDSELTKAVSGLLRWSALKALAENPRVAALDKLAPRGWRPWLVRLVACLAWRADGYRTGERTRQLLTWLEANYGVESGGGVTLPAELDGWLSGVPVGPQTGRGHMALSITRTRVAKTWHAMEQAMEVTLALRGPEKQFEARASVEGLNPYASAARRLFTRIGSSDPELLNVITALAGQSFVELRLDQHASWVCWEALVGLGIQDLLGTEDETFHFRRRVEQSRTRRVASWEKVRHAVVLTNDLRAASAAQEAWLHLVDEFGFVCEIRDTGLLRERNSNVKTPGVLHVVGGPTETSAGVRLDLSAEREWRQGTRGVVGGTRGSGDGGTYGGGHSSIAGSWGGGSTGGGGSGSGGGSRGGGSAGASDRGELVRAETLASLMPNMAMCILQATPSPNITLERTQTEREQAGYLRYMGAELSRLGVPVVVTIPPFPVQIGWRVLRTFLGGFLFFREGGGEDLAGLEVAFPELNLPKKGWSTAEAGFAFLKTLADARAYVKNPSFTYRDDALEAALDLCLYVADARA